MSSSSDAPPPHVGGRREGDEHATRSADLRERVEELEAAHTALRDRLDFLDLIFQGDRLAAYDWAVDSGEVAFDSQLATLLGYDADERITTVGRWRELQHPEDGERVRAAGSGFLDGRVPLLDVEYRVRHKDGSWQWVRDRGRPVERDDRNRPLRVRGALRDIDSRKRAEHELRESERKYRSVIENIVDVFYRSDAQGRLLMGSPSGARMFGFASVDEMIGLPLDSFWPDPEERARLLAEVRASGSVQDFEAVLRRKDGSTFHVSFSTHLYYDEHGRPLGTEGIIRDISERKRAEAERLRLERQLLHAQKLESLGVLAGGIAHDFNNLLMAVLGNLDISLSQLDPTSPARGRIEQAMQATHRATELANQMLAYSGKGRFVVSSLDLGALLRENSNLFRSAVAKSITMDLRLGPGRCMVEANPGQIQQVIMNLITNASEAIGEDAGTITLATGLLSCDDQYLAQSRLDEKAPPGKYVYVEVADDGCGMKRETLQRIFDPFFTTKFTGRGLGMSAVLGIVRGHRGAVMVDSVRGRGTTVRVLLPACEAPAASGTRSPSPPERASVDRAPTGTILVVDDEPTVREICAEYAEQLGHHALSAADGKAALALYREHADEITCVLLDLTMPQMDGLTTLRELRLMRPDVKVILCSGYDELDAVRRFGNEGLCGFLHKPYLLSELKAKLDEALEDSLS